jgi:hypothetical protein
MVRWKAITAITAQGRYADGPQRHYISHAIPTSCSCTLCNRHLYGAAGCLAPRPYWEGTHSGHCASPRSSKSACVLLSWASQVKSRPLKTCSLQCTVLTRSHHPPPLPLIPTLAPLLHLARTSHLPFIRKLGRLGPPPASPRSELVDLYRGPGRVGLDEWEGAMRAWGAVEQRLGK